MLELWQRRFNMAKNSTALNHFDLHDKRLVRRLVLLAILLLVLYVFVPQIGGFSASFHILLAANWALVPLAIALMFTTYCVAALTYQILGGRSLPYKQTLAVQLATGFTSRLLPAGLGGLSLNVLYLRKKEHSLSAALAIGTTNNTIGWFGHLILLLGVVVFTDVSLSQLHVHRTLLTTKLPYIFVILLVVAVINLVIFGAFRKMLFKTLGDVLTYFIAYKNHSGKLVLAVLNSLVLTSLYVGILFVCARALGVELSFYRIFIVFTAGMFVGSITPTPGGLLGAEAGLVGGFVAYGLNSPDALAVALLYRLITYWLPIIPGLAMFNFVQRRYI